MTRRLLAAALSAAILVLSPGLEAPRLVAQTLRAVPLQGALPATGAAAPATRSVPALPALAASVLAAPLSAAAPALSAPASALAAPAAPAAADAAPVLAAPSEADASAPKPAAPAAAAPQSDEKARSLMVKTAAELAAMFPAELGLLPQAEPHGALGLGQRDALLNPSATYGEARKKAVEIAAARGASAEKVLFVQATASMPVRDGAHWKYAFAIPGRKGGEALVYVDFERLLGGPLETRVSVYEGAPVPAQGRTLRALEPLHFKMGTRALDPQGALDWARRVSPALRAQASVSVDLREEPVSGDQDLWYSFYDDRGNAVSVNARTGDARPRGPLPASLRASISPASPIEGFSSFVYERALAEGRRLAAAAGRQPGKLFVTGARLAPRAWGEDWTFSFVSPREDSVKDPREYSVTVRRTMVAETQLDAIEARDLGTIRMFAGVPAARLPELVKIDPMAAIARSGDDARSLELQARWPKGDGETRLWYVIRGEKGRELKAVDAKSGVETVPAPYAWVAGFLTWLAGASLTAAIYGMIYYALAHAPAASVSVPNGWQGPIPDIGRVFGALGAGALGLGTLVGSLRKTSRAAPRLTDDAVRARAAAVVGYKGMPWSQTEYNAAYYPALESLEKDGATPAQLELFKRLCAEAPVRGGRFNPWSGD